MKYCRLTRDCDVWNIPLFRKVLNRLDAVPFQILICLQIEFLFAVVSPGKYPSSFYVFDKYIVFREYKYSGD